MRLKKDIISISCLKSQAAEMLEQVNITHRPVVITQNGEARAVLQDPDSFERMKTALGLMKLIAHGEENIRAAKIIEQDQLFDRLKKKMSTMPKQKE
jgi:prevent-host-death family protein